ncbi:hypothetical protein HYFRA_00008920 [Hymenoscyphus fraxineus]|uniref:Uncharacterized protein n=1 Tax=Hymenoscyphus fraxineus TaxID=746836 RepID=A0A9N9KU25_9HELO|nr:hypothetical protein HYFRA_00008920 [Hymenoscyphus fraxineus]
MSLAGTSDMSTTSYPKTSFLGMPLDIRTMIYEMLLVNPMLGTSLAVTKSDNYGVDTKYDLHPAILAVCRQTYLEGTSTLYGLNTFYIAPLPDFLSARANNYENSISPVTRYHNALEHNDNDFGNIHRLLKGAGSLGNLKAMKAVRSWKVVIMVDIESTNANVGTQAEPIGLFRFCCAIAHSSPRSMDIAIVPKGMIRIGYPANQYISMGNMLQPLSNVRNVETVRFRDATIFEIPDFVAQDEDALEFHSHMEEEALLEVQLVEQMQGNVKIEFAYEMYHPLLRYAQAFEQYGPFKELMALTEDEYTERDGIGSDDDYANWCAKGNPFYGDYVHPVEKNLMAAKLEAGKNHVSAFKALRKSVLEYLENQYQRITKAAGDLSNFVLTQKSTYGLFDPNTRHLPVYLNGDTQSGVLTAMVLLENYSTSFKRDMPLETKMQCYSLDYSFSSLYGMMEPNFQFERVVRAFEASDLRDFVKWYQNAVDLFDEQYLEIRAARKQLFKFDMLEEFGVTLGPEDMHLIEHINWEVEEPEIGPWEQGDWHYDYWDDGDSGDYGDSGDDDSNFDDQVSQSTE